jgi:hypothetical protein
MRTTWIVSAILATSLSGTIVLAQDSTTAQDNTPTHEGPTLGGHIGFAIPLVTESRGNWTDDPANQFSIAFPVGITVKGSGHLAFDLEFDPTINTTGTRATTLAVAPGLIYGLGHGWALGTRLAFNVNSSSWGVVPLINHSWPIKRESSFFKAYFIEGDFPVLFNRTVGQPASDPFTFQMHFGLGF